MYGDVCAVDDPSDGRNNHGLARLSAQQMEEVSGAVVQQADRVGWSDRHATVYQQLDRIFGIFGIFWDFFEDFWDFSGFLGVFFEVCTAAAFILRRERLQGLTALQSITS